MRIPEKFIRNALCLKEMFFLQLANALYYRQKRRAARLLLRAGRIIHPRSVILAEARFEMDICPDRIERALQNYTLPTHAKFAGRIASLLETTGRQELAGRFWQTTRDSFDRNGHSALLQTLLKRVEISSQELLTEQRQWADKYAAFAPCSLPLREDYSAEGPLRIGFACSFFQGPTMLNQFFPWLNNLAAQGHHIFLYGDADFFLSPNVCVRNIPLSVSDHDFCQSVRNDNLDILIETSGFSPGHRFAALAERAAPVQASYLNHAGTTGVSNVDFNLADAIAVNPAEEQFYSETICRLRRCFFCFNFEHEKMPFSPGLPYFRNHCWTFGFFGCSSKLNDFFVTLIADVLREIPGSRLILANAGFDYPPWRKTITSRFSNLGIAPSRLRILPRQTRLSIARLHQEMDFTFDSFPYCGGNTLSEDLWLGVPGASLLGNRFAARYGASILHYAGLSDWIAHSREEFVAIYRQRCQNPNQMQELRQNLRGMLTAPQGYADTAAFAEDFAAACREMLCRQFPAQHQVRPADLRG